MSKDACISIVAAVSKIDTYFCAQRYKGCSRGISSCPVIVAHGIRGGCGWDGSRACTFLAAGSTARHWAVRFSSADRHSALLPLVQACTTVACRLSTTADENAQLMVATTLRNSLWKCRICSIKQCYYAVSGVVSKEIGQALFLE